MSAVNKNKLWGGFLDGKLDMREMDTGWGGFGAGALRKMPAIFATKKAAREEYEDVRPVKVMAIGKRQ